MKKVLIVIPTYNEADNIKTLVAIIDETFRNQVSYKADILFVDDHSPDGTAKAVKAAQTKREGIYLLSGDKQGLGKAYIRGLTYGLELKLYYAIVTMDADLSHDPKDIPRLLAGLAAGADYVIGSRYIAGGHIVLSYSPLRRLQSTIANYIAKYFIDIKPDIKDLTGGFKAIRAKSLKAVPLQRIDASGYVFQVSLLYEFAQRKYAIREVPITFHPRKHGQSKLAIRDVIEFLRLTFRLNPYARLPRMIRFASVGASGTIVNVVVLVSLVRFARLDVTIAYLIALEISIISNFLLNHWFTFGFVNKANKAKEADAGVPALAKKAVRYNLVSLGGVAIALAVFSLAHRKLGINYVIADLLGIVAAMSWNYWLSLRLVWRIIDARSGSKAEVQSDA